MPDVPRLRRAPGPRPGVGIVHLGLGAFFRAHGAIYVSEAMAASGGDWGIVGVSLVRSDQRDALAPQGFAYTVVELGPEGETPRVVDVVQDVLVAREDPEAVLAAMADPGVRIVSLTVTEKGYCHEPATGRLNPEHPDIAHDLAHPEAPRSAPGFLVAGLARRRTAGGRPFTVLCCDNLPANGHVVRGVTLDLARLVDPSLADWIEADGRFPSTMVDRIVPATKPEDIARLTELTGVEDRSPVMHEPFRQWVVEDDFVDGARPDLGAVGVQLVADVTPFELMKLRMLNGTHSSLAYLGYLAGHETIADAVGDAPFAALCRHLWRDEIIPTIAPPPGEDLGAYAELGGCEIELLEVPAPLVIATWGGPDHDEIHRRTENGVWRVTWQGEELHVVQARWRDGYSSDQRSWVIAKDKDTAHAFVLDAARETNDPRDAILVFHGGCWQRSHDLYREIERASFDDLILAKTLKDRIRDDFRRFLSAREAYEAHGLPWRRGALFIGPPGNGKTHTVRALVRELGVPALYVQSVKTRYETEESNLKKVFERARQLRPCVLVLEDIDALINPGNRSFFLNQLDGFEKNVGLIVLATTNHPDRIDGAIIDRPSRFDRKYHFELPALTERQAYLTLWQKRFADRTRWADESVSALAARTDGFSFAYLKELVVTSLMGIVAGETNFAAVIEREQASLAEQMKKIVPTLEGEGNVVADDLDD